MPFEYRLMVEGYNDQQRSGLRREAGWMSYLMTGLVKEEITPEQLLGEAPRDDSARLKAAARKIDRMLKKRRKLLREDAKCRES